MLYLPPLRRLLVPSLICLAFVLAYRSSHRLNKSYISSLLVEQPSIYYPEEKIRIADLNARFLIAKNPDEAHNLPPPHLYYDFVHDEPDDQSFQWENETDTGPKYYEPSSNRYLKPLFECRIKANKFTQHIRIPSYIRRISVVVTGDTENEKREFLNPSPMSLPYWSENQYLLVTRVQTDGTTQLSVICEANICYTDEKQKRPNEKPCTAEDLALLGGAEGMRCVTPPLTLNVPPTPAKHCGDGMRALMEVPGFHDPRIFWSGKGEPLMMMNTQSKYACYGLWVIDLRKLHTPLTKLLGANPKLPTLGPLMSYPHMVEITRNPPETRGPIEKNWMFFSNEHSSYVHYDVGPTVRTFAQLLGGGLTTFNLTDPYEQPCLRDGAVPKAYEVWGGSWHQGTNSLRLILCERNDHSCKSKPENTVFWSLIHHKHKNVYSLPLRYERYFIVWSSTPPFHMLAMSSHPIIFANESASGWDLDETWDDDPEHHEMKKQGGEGKQSFAVFTYTPSIAYAWGRPDDRPQEKNVGYLDDEVILGIGIDDAAHAYARAKVSDLLQCMRACPGRASEKLNKDEDPGQKKQSSFFDADQKDRDTILKGWAEGKTIHEIVEEGMVKFDLSRAEEDAKAREELVKEMEEALKLEEEERKKKEEEEEKKKKEEEEKKKKEEEEKRKKADEEKRKKEDEEKGKNNDEKLKEEEEKKKKEVEEKKKKEEEEKKKQEEEEKKKKKEEEEKRKKEEEETRKKEEEEKRKKEEEEEKRKKEEEEKRKKEEEEKRKKEEEEKQQKAG